MSSIQRPPAQPWIESLIGKHPCTVYKPKPLNPFWQVMEYVICDNLSLSLESLFVLESLSLILDFLAVDGPSMDFFESHKPYNLRCCFTL